MREHQDKNDNRVVDMGTDEKNGVRDSLEKPSLDSPEDSARDTWDGKLDFLMSALSLSVGMGNMWRFPYLCYQNGGGAFLIAYVLIALVLGVPIIFMEYIIGQFGRTGIVRCWKVCPLFTGIGWAIFSLCALGSAYYIVLISWCFYYIFASFSKDVPWKECGNWWNTENCISLEEAIAEAQCRGTNGSWYNDTCVTVASVGEVAYRTIAASIDSNTSNETRRVASSDEYFHRHMLGITEGIHDLGYPQWQLLLCLLLVWTIVFVCLARGIKGSGKVTYVTALFPYLVLAILFGRGMMLEGSGSGLYFYFMPKWYMLAQPKMWADAAIQVFFSLSCAWGGHITLSSYNNFKNNCLRDAVVVVAGDSLTSIFGGVVIFSFIGYMAHVLSVPVDKVATQGAGLAFIVYPEAVTTLPCPQLWSVLFMVMLVNVGIGTQFGLVQTVQVTLLDVFPDSLGKRPATTLLVICCVLFIAGIIMTTHGGMYVLQLADGYVATYTTLILSLLTVLALAWVYGTANLIKDVQIMLGIRLNRVFVIWWRFIVPVLILFILAFSIWDYKPTKYGDYEFPVACDALGWCIVVAEVLCVPLTIAYMVYRRDRETTILQKLRDLCNATPEWRPPVEFSDNNANKEKNGVHEPFLARESSPV